MLPATGLVLISSRSGAEGSRHALEINFKGSLLYGILVMQMRCLNQILSLPGSISVPCWNSSYSADWVLVRERDSQPAESVMSGNSSEIGFPRNLI